MKSPAESKGGIRIGFQHVGDLIFLSELPGASEDELMNAVAGCGAVRVNDLVLCVELPGAGECQAVRFSQGAFGFKDQAIFSIRLPPAGDLKNTRDHRLIILPHRGRGHDRVRLHRDDRRLEPILLVLVPSAVSERVSREQLPGPLNDFPVLDQFI